MALPSILSPYDEAHKNPGGPGDARPTALQILRDNDLVGGKLAGKSILITGGTDGLGLESVRQLIKTGARVYFTARNEGKAKRVLSELAKDAKVDSDSTQFNCDWIKMNHESIKSVHEGASEFLEKSSQLNVLICNAGIANTPYEITKDGFERQFEINYLSHFLLFQLLKPTLIASTSPSFCSRVIAVSSAAHGFSTVQMGNYNLQKKPTSGYDPLIELEGNDNPMIAYGQSKTAMIWLTNQIEHRYSNLGLHGISLHPGNIVTSIMGPMDARVSELLSPYFQLEAFQKAFKSVEQGAATQVLAAVGKDYEGKGGFYMEDCHIARRLGDDEQLGLEGYRPWIYDQENAERLWKDSLEMVGLKDD